MSIDVLQSKIRKLKNPSMIRMDVLPGQIPPQLLEQEGNLAAARRRFERELLEQLRGIIPAVCFHFGNYALAGADMLETLRQSLRYASELGYYVLLEYSGVLTAEDAEYAAQYLCGEDSAWKCDGILVSGFIGDDGIVPFADALRYTQQDLFVAVRTGNKSAAAVQDLMTGGRVSHMAVADIVNRLGKPYLGKHGYSRICAAGPATSASALKNLRDKYKDTFLLVHGYDNPAANAKLCAGAFDKLGYGAVVLSDNAVAAAWCQEDNDGAENYLQCASAAAERMRKNITRYVTVL